MTVFGFERRERVMAFGLLAGAILTIIGIRFLIWPDDATFTFGLEAGEKNLGLLYVIGLRDVWLGVLAIIFALWRAITPLSWWFLLGAVVCFSDALVVNAFSGPLAAIVFHVLSGFFCSAVGLAARAEGKAV